jgi:hypothetical protein
MVGGGLLLLSLIAPSKPRLLIVSSGEFSNILARLQKPIAPKTFSHDFG